MTKDNEVKPVESQQEPDINERIEGFDKELRPLLGKYELGLAAQAFVTPDGRIAANAIVISTRGKVENKKPELSKPE